MLRTVPPEPGCLACLSSHFILGKALMATAAGNPGGGNYGAVFALHTRHWDTSRGCGEGMDCAGVTGPSVDFAWMLIFSSSASLRKAGGHGAPRDAEWG